MNEKEFVSWLKGYLEGIDREKINYAVFDKIKEKLITIKKTP